jgi:hypothetical protein
VRFINEDLTPEQRALLLQVYTIERQDNQTSQTVAFAILAAALTYVVASAAFFISHCNSIACTGVSPLVQLASPLIPLALLSFLVLSVAATLMRAKHVRKLEELLGLEAETGVVFPSFHRDSATIYEPHFDRLIRELKKPGQAGDRKSLIKRYVPQVIYMPLTITTYVPMLLIALGYTIAVLHPGAWTWDKWVAFIVYLLILTAQVAGIILPLGHARFKTDFEVD